MRDPVGTISGRDIAFCDIIYPIEVRTDEIPLCVVIDEDSIIISKCRCPLGV